MLAKPPITFLALMLAIVFAGPTAAQDVTDTNRNASIQSLPNSIIAASSLSGAQKQTVRDYVDRATSLLKSDDDAQVNTGRKKLLEPYGSMTSNTFKALYGQLVLERLTPLVQQARPLVRLNAAIVAARTQQPGTIELAKTLVQSDEAAVRYWAAQALRRYAERADQADTAMDAEQQQAIETTVDTLLANDPSHTVAHPALLALAALNSDSAQQRLTEALRDRLTIHANMPSQPYRAERDAMQQRFRQLRGQANEGNVDNDDIRTLAAIACQYMVLVARQMVDGDLSPEQIDSRGRTIDFTNNVLRWSAGRLNASDYPAPVDGDDDPQRIQTQAKQWQNRLTKTPWGLQSSELEVPKADAPARPDDTNQS